jgi:predicted DNA repair protein MutK
MASGIFAILDDIAALMDDVAVTAKLATKKTAGILGDDLAVNAEKSTGFVSSRELPVLWAITKGSFLNKLIIVPAVLLLNVFLPIAIKIILLIGGFYLAYEGVEKIVEFLFHRKDTKKHNSITLVDDIENEKAKIKSAITTDFILSLEIVIIALSTVLDESLTLQIATTCIVSIIATVGVYGIVAVIVRMDDLGFRFIKRANNTGVLNAIGKGLVNGLPVIIKLLSVVGTIALILVSGGIFEHNIPQMHHLSERVPSIIVQIGGGLIGGGLTLILIKGFTFIYSRITKK